uniref:Uncharacterized protein n=1 Tax=Anguilla anguilla TaxID=7936 RepID=A0A0E9XGM0_ANGAN
MHLMCKIYLFNSYKLRLTSWVLSCIQVLKQVKGIFHSGITQVIMWSLPVAFA